MLDPEFTPARHAAECSNEYPKEATAATPTLPDKIRAEIASRGPLAFPEFMAMALYEPGLGYYAREPRQVGRNGDFFTSVSVGPLFGHLLARRFLQWKRETGISGPWRILEIGAHDGTLAADILDALSTLDETAFSELEYTILEPQAASQAAQHQKLSAFSGKIRIIDSLETLTPLPGIVFGNEVLDALPFHLVEWRSGLWHELHVTANDHGFSWESHPIPETSALAEKLARLGTAFPEGYRTELRTNFRDFLAPLVRAMGRSLFIWPDYGFARPDYYHPDRTAGTLRTFSQHRAASDPLDTPGEIDITAHVDFTDLAETSLSLGGTALAFARQGTWLTHVGKDWLLSMEGTVDPAKLRQFQTLTHPAHLGGSFHVLECRFSDPAAPPASAADLHRLTLAGT
ncbi:MAG: SAM-dependent methyltransferase [Luteolibacter sp.]